MFIWKQLLHLYYSFPLPVHRFHGIKPQTVLSIHPQKQYILFNNSLQKLLDLNLSDYYWVTKKYNGQG